MADLAVTNSFTNGTDSDATQVNQNFQDVVTYVNSQLIRADGSVAFTNVPTGPATDPSSANHLVRKQYVDQHNATNVPITIAATTVPPTTTTIGTATIIDPGYDIEVWGSALVLCQPNVAGTLDNIWELSFSADSVQQTICRIPVATGQQCLAVPCQKFTHLTGSNCVVNIQTARAAGSQINLGILASVPGTKGEIWWRRK